jgi:hypothetical protein
MIRWAEFKNKLGKLKLWLRTSIRGDSLGDLGVNGRIKLKTKKSILWYKFIEVAEKRQWYPVLPNCMALHSREQDSHRCENLKAIALGLDIPAWRIVICHEVALHLSLRTAIYPYGLIDTSKMPTTWRRSYYISSSRHIAQHPRNMIALRYPL